MSNINKIVIDQSTSKCGYIIEMLDGEIIIGVVKNSEKKSLQHMHRIDRMLYLLQEELEEVTGDYIDWNVERDNIEVIIEEPRTHKNYKTTSSLAGTFHIFRREFNAKSIPNPLLIEWMKKQPLLDEHYVINKSGNKSKSIHTKLSSIHISNKWLFYKKLFDESEGLDVNKTGDDDIADAICLYLMSEENNEILS